ncbi:enoyl-CoA hydratase [Rhodococcus sp. AD45-ID]|jgi:enoyl-CoA hydratase|uniref:crotonase/enoyl-CoA hydratase family protein n=1 Tax=unclassified Rhodococcus (in: high G+C Gram-positive bacteria) TaxID=192944 RepID=UPI0005D3FD82|nr:MULTISPECIES: crotonase/enoyl-CoA hydratase family protein [unclassified Rhodococcus (in: high G+C Gram-positive bacteria)]KJF21652.1 Carnitinyl-CoA dehydratase [Rhodococcus sp. AD45]NRI69103.1 crotonase/enoyl-CoA hydratase family protein [Rhodococcus sp. MS16]PSR39105.1 enoyl-CoA hydratase [Rhodococcus sp. AD45-ID]
MADEVLTERRGRTLIITINRPEARNAINAAVSHGLAAAVEELDGNDELSLAVLTGAGGNFCAGMDLKAFVAGENVLVPGRGLGFTEGPPRKPIISAVEGFALAGGTELVLATDLVVASREAKFGIPEVKRGLVAGAGGLFRLPKRIPYQKALEYALTGDAFTAEEAHSYGLVNTLTEPGQALDGALDLADRISRNGPLAVTVTKEIMVKAAGWSDDEAFANQMQLLAPIFVSEDAREGATAFAEKRAPVWKGR